MNLAFKKLVLNIFLWLVFVIVANAYYAIQNDLGLYDPIPYTHLYKYIDYKFLSLITFTAFFLACIFSIRTHKLADPKKINNSRQQTELALNELSGILYNIGSMTFAVGISVPDWNLAAFSLLPWGVGYFFCEKSAPNKANHADG